MKLNLPLFILVLFCFTLFACAGHDLEETDPLYSVWQFVGYGSDEFVVNDSLPDEFLFPVELEFIFRRDFEMQTTGPHFGHFSATSKGTMSVNPAMTSPMSSTVLIMTWDARILEDIETVEGYKIQDNQLNLSLKSGEQMIFDLK